MKILTIFLIIFLTILATLSAGVLVYAHGEDGGPSDEALHEATQIGLPGAKEGHAGGKEVQAGLTRTEIADLVHDEQDAENARSGIKIILLVLLLAIVLFLFYPKKPLLVSQPAAVGIGENNNAPPKPQQLS